MDVKLLIRVTGSTRADLIAIIISDGCVVDEEEEGAHLAVSLGLLCDKSVVLQQSISEDDRARALNADGLILFKDDGLVCVDGEHGGVLISLLGCTCGVFSTTNFSLLTSSSFSTLGAPPPNEKKGGRNDPGREAYADIIYYI